MIRKSKNASIRIFDALAAPMRLQILQMLYSKGPSSYSEIMAQLNLNPNRDAGKFAYHLRTLQNSRLLSTEKETKKYSISPLGTLMLEMSQRIDRESLKEEGRLLVRTSQAAMEDFDRNKIVQVLNREADMPTSLAQRIAKETEQRLLKLEALYLTAPLIRELVNAVLIERGLHEYRHKLTRLGLPIYDVSQLLGRDTQSTNMQNVRHLVARNVFSEYTLLNILPRSVADAHLSGLLQVNYIDGWALGPQNVQHDLRLFLRYGFRPRRIDTTSIPLEAPEDLSQALPIISSILWQCRTSVIEEQTINHFNVFLAPFTKDIQKNQLHYLLWQFLISLSQATDSMNYPRLTLGLDITIPSALEDVEALQSGGKICGRYGDYHDEAREILETLIDLAIKDTKVRPLFTPLLIFTVTERDLEDIDSEDILLKVHSLAADRGTPLFVNLDSKFQNNPVYNSTGLRLTELTGDWELDKLRTGTSGSIGINLPRIAYGSKGEEKKFFTNLDECLEMIVEAIEIKAKILENQLSLGLLPFLSQRFSGEPYFRSKNMQFHLGLIGLNEATKIQTGRQLYENRESTEFALRIVIYLKDALTNLYAEKGHRIAVGHGASEEASQRFALLDVERFGWGTVFTQGAREAPYYTDLTVTPLNVQIPLKDRLTLEGVFHTLFTGGHLLPVELIEPKQKPEALLSTTKSIVSSTNIGAFTYNRVFGYCDNCHSVTGGLNQKCANCDAFKGYTTFSRLSTRYRPLDKSSSLGAITLSSRQRYKL